MDQHHALVLLLAFLLIPLHSSPFANAASDKHLVVAGDVKAIKCRIENGTIYSYVTFFVAHVKDGPDHLKNAEITIKHLGGAVNETILWSPEEPTFYIGEKAELTIEPEEEHFKVVGKIKGKKNVDQDYVQITQRTAAGYTLCWYHETLGFATSTTCPGPEWYGPMRWSVNVLHYYINTQGIPSGLSPASFIYYATMGFQTWKDDPASVFDFIYEGPSTNSYGDFDGVNLVGWKDIGESTIAMTKCWGIYVPGDYDSVRIMETDMCFDSLKDWSAEPAGVLGKYDVQNIATHEAGHTFGLGDMYDGMDLDHTMYGYADTQEIKKRDLTWGDQAGIYTLYPYQAVTVHTTFSTTTSTTSSTTGSTTFTTTQTRYTTSATATTSTFSFTTTSTHWSSGALPTTYTTYTTLVKTMSTSFSTVALSSNGEAFYTTTELIKTGFSTSEALSTTAVTYESTAYVTVVTNQTFVELWLERVLSVLSRWFSQLIQVTQSSSLLQTDEELVVKVEPEGYPRGTTRAILDASPKPGIVNRPVTFSGTVYGSWRPIRDGMVVNRPVEISTSWGYLATVDTDGFGRFTVQTTCPTRGGTYDVTLTYYEDQDLQGCSETIQLQVIEYIETTLSLSYMPTQYGMGSATKFYGSLREKDSGKPVAGKSILLTVMGGGNAWTYTLTTDSQGYYELIYANNGGIFTWAEARFSGDGLFLPSYSGRIVKQG